MKPRHPPPEVCPACGADVPPDSAACPDCGADENTGWNQDAAVYDGVDLPDKEFNHDEFVKKEFGSAGNSKPRHAPWMIAAVILSALLLLALLAGMLR